MAMASGVAAALEGAKRGSAAIPVLRVGTEVKAALDLVTCGLGNAGLAATYTSLADDSGAAGQAREAAMLFSVAEAHLDAEEASEALQRAREAAELFRALGDRRGAVDALRVVVGALRLLEDTEAAWATATDELARFRALGDRRGMAAMLVALAEVELADDDAEAAQSSASQASALAREAGDLRLEGAALHALAAVLMERGDGAAAARAAVEALELFRSLEDRNGKVQSLHRLAQAQLCTKDFREALRLAQEARELARELGSGRREVAELLLEAEALAGQRRHREALKVATDSLALARKIDFTKGEAAALCAIVRVHLAAGKADQAVKAAKTGLERFQAAGEQGGQIAALDALADALGAGGERRGALAAAEEALLLCRDLGLRKKEAILLLHVSLAQVKAELADEGSRGLLQALEIFRSVGSGRGMATALLGLASLHLSQGLFELALEESQDARALLLQAGNGAGLAPALDAVCSAHRALGDYDEAAAAALAGKAICQEAGDEPGEAEAWLKVAELRMENMEHERALVAARQAQLIAQDLGDLVRGTRLRAEALHVVAGVHLQLGELEEACRVAQEAEVLCRKASRDADSDLDLAKMKLLVAEASCQQLWSEGARLEEDSDPLAYKRIKSVHERTLRKAQAAVSLAREASARDVLAKALLTLGSALVFAGKFEDAHKALQESRGIFRESRDAPGEFGALTLMATACMHADDRPRAAELLGEAAGLAEKEQDEAGAEFIASWLSSLHEVPQPTQQQPTTTATTAETQVHRSPDPHDVRQYLSILIQQMSGGDEDLEGDEPWMTRFDSLSVVEMRAKLQQEFRLTLPSTVFFNYPTPSALTRLLVDECAAKRISWRSD